MSMDWKIGLDRYLTTPPEDEWDGLPERIWNLIPETLISDYEYDLIDDRIQVYEDYLIRKLFCGYYRSLDEVADILGRFTRRMIDEGRWHV